MLQAELGRRRQVAREMVQSLEQGGLPLTQADWISWFRRHQDQFCESMQSASSARKSANRRLSSAEGLPSPVSRLLPCKASTAGAALSPWKLLLAGRSGWHLLQQPSHVVRLFFLVRVQGRHVLLGFICLAAWQVLYNRWCTRH